MSESINTSGKFYLAHFGKYSMSIYSKDELMEMFSKRYPWEYTKFTTLS